jgi:hypothetical protein
MDKGDESWGVGFTLEVRRKPKFKMRKWLGSINFKIAVVVASVVKE